jgi:hypothetical protein
MRLAGLSEQPDPCFSGIGLSIPVLSFPPCLNCAAVPSDPLPTLTEPPHPSIQSSCLLWLLPCSDLSTVPGLTDPLLTLPDPINMSVSKQLLNRPLTRSPKFLSSASSLPTPHSVRLYLSSRYSPCQIRSLQPLARSLVLSIAVLPHCLRRPDIPQLTFSWAALRLLSARLRPPQSSA